MGSAGIRPNRQCRSCPHGRASSIQPSLAAIYSFAKARISCWSLAGSIPENIYAALPLARNERAVGLAQADMHSKVSMLKSRISAMSDAAKIPFRASAKATPFGVSSPSLRQVEHMNKVWRNGWSFRLKFASYIPPNLPGQIRQDSAHLIDYNLLNT